MTAETFTLDYPVELAGKPKVESLTLRRPKVRDVKKLESGKGSESDRSIAMFADLAEVEPAVIEELDPTDYAKLNAWLEPIISPKD